MHERVLGSTFEGGRFRVERHLHGQGLRQMFLGIDSTNIDPVLISYDKLPRDTTIEDFVFDTGGKSLGVLDLLFAGRPDDGVSYWAVIERIPANTLWLPAVLGQHHPDAYTDAMPKRLPSHDPTSALPIALALGRSAGRILADNAARRDILARVRPETMWITGDTVVQLSERSERMFAASWVSSFTTPVFDRYYHAPEVDRKQPVDDRALVFALSIMIAEWATGLYPFAKKHYAHGPIEDNQVALDVPARLAALLGSGMRIDVARRPTLTAFLAELDRC